MEKSKWIKIDNETEAQVREETKFVRIYQKEAGQTADEIYLTKEQIIELAEQLKGEE